ncbi:type VII secretion target [Gordonia paraffinivorans]|uniref:type VII secretion target n=1 Tax=Gordonia paraffinivorans TaxID=175628 RepID=UPI001447D975|nr:type VII secretion target [Gordonia paraffinivorans]
MDQVKVTPEALEGFAAANAAVATAIGTAGSIDAAANTAAMVPVFGLIGQEFLAAFIVTQANHLMSVGQLAAVHAATAATTSQSLVAYEDADATGAAGVRSAL